MKRYWPTIIVVAIFAILLAYVIYIYKFKPAEQIKSQVIFHIDKSKISSVVLTSKGSTIELKKVNGKYVMDIPEEVLAVQNKVQKVFQTASKIDYQSIISQNESNLSQYGFENPDAVVKISMTDDTAKTFQVGMKTPSDDGYYFRENGKDTVYKVSSDIAGQFVQGINDIADKNIFSEFDKSIADKIEVIFDTQTVTIEKKKGAWQIDGKVLKQDRTNQLLDQFQVASVDGIAAKDKYADINTPPLVKIVVYENDKETLNTIIIQRDENTLNVIKEGMAEVQYYISMDSYNKIRDNLVAVFQDAVAQ